MNRIFFITRTNFSLFFSRSLMIVLFALLCTGCSSDETSRKGKSLAGKSNTDNESLNDYSSTQDYTCEDLPLSFSSNSAAVSQVRNATFLIEESANTSRSSWIDGAEYYSCDRQAGYFILLTNSREYIHKGVPISVWRGFKGADSFGSYYNRNIKGRYGI